MTERPGDRQSSPGRRQGTGWQPARLSVTDGDSQLDGTDGDSDKQGEGQPREGTGREAAPKWKWAQAKRFS